MGYGGCLKRSTARIALLFAALIPLSVFAANAQSGSDDVSVHTTKVSFHPGESLDKKITYDCEPSGESRLVCTARVPANGNIRVATVQIRGERRTGRFGVTYTRYAYSAEITFERGANGRYRFESATGRGDAAGSWNIEQPGGAPVGSGPGTINGLFHSDHINLETEKRADGTPRAILTARYTIRIGGAWGVFAAADDSTGARERCRTNPCTAHSACDARRCHVISRVDVTPSNPKALGYEEPMTSAFSAGRSQGATGTFKTEQGRAHLLLIAPSRPLNPHRDSGRRLGVVALPGSRCIASGTWGPVELGRATADDDGIATFRDELLDWVRRGDRRTEGGNAEIRVSCEREDGDQADVVRTFKLD